MVQFEERKMETKSFRKNVAFFFVVVTSIIYMGWRFIFTIPYQYGIASIIFGLFLFLSELAGVFESLLQFYGMRNYVVPKKPILPYGFEYPHVDVFISTYNEEEDLLYKTIIGCKGMEYPDKAKVHIYLCDDGNRSQMALFAETMGIGYLTREEHIDAKAGNLNNALAHTSSPYVATFDADMIPLHHFLMETIPYFYLPQWVEVENSLWQKRKKPVTDLKIGFIQAPQSFYNADLFQYYLYAEKKVPNEQDFFYRDIQLSRNKSHSAIYGGSNTVLSREALDEIGGFYTGVITEDFATGISIQNSGYTCYAIDEVLAIGLSPTDLKSLIKQRERWARGCIQTLRKVRFLFLKNLTVSQKISYFSSLLYWYTPFRRLMYIISPILFVLFDVMIVKATFFEMLLFWGPYYLAYMIALRHLSRNIRNNRWSNVYDTIMFPSLLVPIFLETLCISKKTFSITTKKRIDNERKYKMIQSIPHLLLSILSAISIAIAFSTLLKENALFYLIIIFWLITNLYSLLMSFLFMLGRKTYRQSERFYAQLEAIISFSTHSYQGETFDISEGGFSIVLDFPQVIPENEVIKVVMKDAHNHATVQAQLVQCIQMREKWKYGFTLTHLSDENRANYVKLIYDRLPSLPKCIDKSSSSFEDLSKNLMLRLSKGFNNQNDKIPHIKLNKQFVVEENQIITLVMFSFYTCQLKMEEHNFKDELLLGGDLQCQLYLRFIRLNEKSQTYEYQVENIDELLVHPYLSILLQLWIKEYCEYTAENSRKRKNVKNRFVGIEEFDERKLYNGETI